MNKDLFQIFLKFAVVLFIFQGVMLFIVDFLSAEFYVLIFGMILMALMIAFCMVKARKENKQ